MIRHDGKPDDVTGNFDKDVKIIYHHVTFKKAQCSVSNQFSKNLSFIGYDNLKQNFNVSFICDVSDNCDNLLKECCSQ